MLLTVLLAVMVAKLNRFRLSPLRKAYALYPFVLVEVSYWLLQICTFMGNYTFIPYASYVKSAYFLVLFIPIIAYKLYAPALVGSAFILAGTGMNRWVMFVNGGEMPVYPSLSRLTGYYNETVISTVDTIHCVGTADTKWKILTDFIDVGWSILSIGDLFIHAFTFIIIFYSIKRLNRALV
jgi:hypothetical protein